MKLTQNHSSQICLNLEEKIVIMIGEHQYIKSDKKKHLIKLIQELRPNCWKKM